MLSRFRKPLRRHAHFFCVIVPLILLMTYPTITHVFDTSKFWLPAVDWDAWLKIWDAWHFKQVLAGESSLYHTNLLFYPHGVSLAYQTYSLPFMLVMNALQAFLPPSNAYCLTYLLNIFVCALSGYIYCLYLFKDKWLALPGAVIFGLSQQVTGKAMEPDTSFIATLPLTMYCLHRGIDEGRTRLLALAGLLLGFTAYCGMYIFVCAALTAGLFVLCCTRSRWRDRRFWRDLALFAMLAIVTSAGRVAPMVSDPGELDRAIQLQVDIDEGGDVMGLAFNYRHPILTPFFKAVAGIEAKPLAPNRKVYIHGQVLRYFTGLSTLLLIAYGLLRRSSRRKMLPWLLIAAFFIILRLGPALKINGVVYHDILLPKYYLDQLLPMVFASFHSPDHFQIGVLLPTAALACYGLGALLPLTSRGRRAPIVLLLVAIIAFETYFLPYAMEVDRGRFKYTEWLAAQDDQESIRLAPLPMQIYDYGSSQIHLLHQTMHGYPMTGGYVARNPPSTYRYIDGNPLLSAGRNEQGIICSQSRQSDILSALDQMLADGFSHIVLHKRQAGAAPFLASFADMTPAYEDWHTLIYDIAEMRNHCQSPPPGTESLALYLELVYGNVMPPREEPFLAFHPSERINDEALRYMSWNADFGKNLNHVTVDAAGQLSLQSTYAEARTIADIASSHAAILLLRHPHEGDVGHTLWNDWLTRHYQFCQPIAANEHIAIDHYLSRDMPCDLVTSDAPLALMYDNGNQLRNRVVEIDGGDLRLHLWWRLADGPKTSYSIQVFDGGGERLRQIDHVMNRALVSHTIDVSDLPAGAYQARLIVYDFASGASHGGEVIANASRFRREVEIARFRLEV